MISLISHDSSEVAVRSLSFTQMNAHPWLFDFGGIILVANEVVRRVVPPNESTSLC